MFRKSTLPNYSWVKLKCLEFKRYQERVIYQKVWWSPKINYQEHIIYQDAWCSYKMALMAKFLQYCLVLTKSECIDLAGLEHTIGLMGLHLAVVFCLCPMNGKVSNMNHHAELISHLQRRFWKTVRHGSVARKMLTQMYAFYPFSCGPWW